MLKPSEPTQTCLVLRIRGLDGESIELSITLPLALVTGHNVPCMFFARVRNILAVFANHIAGSRVEPLSVDTLG